MFSIINFCCQIRKCSNIPSLVALSVALTAETANNETRMIVSTINFLLNKTFHHNSLLINIYYKKYFLLNNIILCHILN